MTMRWLMTIQETGTFSPALGRMPAGVEFDLRPRWISRIDDEPPNPDDWDRLHQRLIKRDEEASSAPRPYPDFYTQFTNGAE